MDPTGFTLLEILVALTILGFLTAMVVPAMGVMDNRARAEETVKRMERIRRAMLGDPDRYDEKGRRIIGGYVGDMRRWPELWEARAEIRPKCGDPDWDDPAGPAEGLGQGPGYDLSPIKAFYRPSGRFVKGRWRWNTPYRKLENRSDSNDHIGGLETENEGQPRGLWTRYTEDLNFTVKGASAGVGDYEPPGTVEGSDWKGPYLNPALDENLKDALHFADDEASYEALEPFWHNSGPHNGFETWEDGSYEPTSELGELFDEKESFRLLQNDGRLADGWGRAFRFFITEDKDRAGSTIFWIISEGPDYEGRYPTKGSCPPLTWDDDPDDTMGQAYDPDDTYNADNIVMKLFSYDWEAVFEEEKKEKEAATRKRLEVIRKAVVGEAPTGLNYGFTGDLCRLPKLFRWEGSSWDDADESNAYTKGQPRGLWTDTPNTADSGDDLPESTSGIGWRHRSLKEPGGIEDENVLQDAWGRDLLFFYDGAGDALLVLSRGADGKFNFLSTNPEKTEPESLTEAVDTSGYDPSVVCNQDNLHLLIDQSDWMPGFFRLAKLTVFNATANVTKLRFFRGGTDAASETKMAESLVDADADTQVDDWVVGDGTVPALVFNDTTAEKAVTGARYLVIWNDTDIDAEGLNTPDPGEEGITIIYPLLGVSGSGQQGELTLDVGDFKGF
ncbi:prepilin-type N-terminal cleavage/methylation domain-containing protein [Desulfoluna sp.]|uniref:prepilin-type N-terminal cleavage/methylation domain-containing protein n=1 Tax=Desulfoluna sp. TaxID=2045199 RepID=UPI00260B0181|nr:prepilin-type N-terminal cleavage/methylation domain-containing protein [Desulfoluna sp.]